MEHKTKRYLKWLSVLPFFLLAFLVLPSAGEAPAASVTPPDTITLAVDWNATAESTTYTVEYDNDTGSQVDLTADIKSDDLPTSAVSGLDVNIKRDGEKNWVTLGDGEVATLKSSIPDGTSSSITDVLFQLNATGVPVNDANIGNPVTYIITFTLS